jgi:hypothetical protein
MAEDVFITRNNVIYTSETAQANTLSSFGSLRIVGWIGPGWTIVVRGKLTLLKN